MIKLTHISFCFLYIFLSTSIHSQENKNNTIDNNSNKDKLIHNYIGKLKLNKDSLSIQVTYFKLVNTHMNSGNYSKSIAFSDSCLKYINKSDHLNLSKVFNSKALAQINLGYIEKGLNNLDTALKHGKVTNYIPEIINILINYSVAYYSLNQFQNSYNVLTEAIDLAKKIEDFDSLIYAYYNISEMFHETEKYEKAVQYFNQAIQYAKKAKNILLKAVCQVGLSNSLLKLNRINNATELLNEAIDTLKNNNFSKFEGIAYNNLANCYYRKNEYSNAIYELKKAEKLLHTIPIEIEKVYLNYSNNYIKLFKIEKALEYCKRTTKVNKKTNTKKIAAENYFLLSKIYEYKKEYKKSIRFLKKASKINDDLIYQGLNNSLNEIQIIFDGVTEDNKKLLLIEERNILKNIEKNQNTKLKLILTLITLTIVILITLFYLSKKIKIILNKNKKLIKDKDLFFEIVSNNFISPINNIKNNLKSSINSKAYVDFTYKSLKIVNSTLILLENLLFWSNHIGERVNIEKQSIDIVKMLNNILNDQKLYFNNIKINYTSVFDSIFVRYDHKILNNTLTNFLYNTFRIAENKTPITIILNQTKTYCNLKIEAICNKEAVEELKTILSENNISTHKRLRKSSKLILLVYQCRTSSKLNNSKIKTEIKEDCKSVMVNFQIPLVNE